MRLFTLLIFLFGIAQTSAYSVPGGYERVLIYYMYIIDAQLNGGLPQKIATGCNKKKLCTFDQLLRYIASSGTNLPTQTVPEPKEGQLPDMDTTAKYLWTKDANGRDWAGQIDTGHVLTGASRDYSKFLYQLGSIAVSFAESSPDNADLLKRNIQAIRTTRRNAQLTSFMEDTANADIKVATKDEILYDGAPDDDDHKTKVINDAETLTQNPALTRKELNRRWSANTEGGHFKNVQALRQVLEMMKDVCA